MPTLTSCPAILALTPGGSVSVTVILPWLSPAPTLKTSTPIVPLEDPIVVTDTVALVACNSATFTSPSNAVNVTAYAPPWPASSATATSPLPTFGSASNADWIVAAPPATGIAAVSSPSKLNLNVGSAGFGTTDCTSSAPC